jgi:hypothetical protein
MEQTKKGKSLKGKRIKEKLLKACHGKNQS